MGKLVKVLGVAVVGTALVASPALAKTLKIGIPLPLTGSKAKFGEIERRSYEIAAEEINAAGGINGMQIELDIQDSQGKPEIARAIAEKLVDVAKQPFLIGAYSSSCSKAIAALAEERKVPYLVVTGAANDITQKGYEYVFRMNPSVEYYTSGFRGFLREVVKPKTIAILYEATDFGTSGSKSMVKEAKRLGIKVVLNEKYESGAVDFKPILSQVKAKRPDVIYMVSYVMDAALLMRQIKELRIDAKLFAGGAAGFAIPEFVENAKDAAEYVVTATLWSPFAPYRGAREFAEKYKKRAGKYPSYHGAEAYSALYVLKDALERAGSMDSEAIKKALAATDLVTAFGPVKFEAKGKYKNQNFMDTLVLQVINGKHEVIWPKKFATAKYVFPIPRWRDRRR